MFFFRPLLLRGKVILGPSLRNLSHISVKGRGSKIGCTEKAILRKVWPTVSTLVLQIALTLVLQIGAIWSTLVLQIGAIWSTAIGDKRLPTQLLLQTNFCSEGREWEVGAVVVDFRVFGAPRFSVQTSQNTYFKGFWGLWKENRGAPKTRKSTATDPAPHSRPSEFFEVISVFLCIRKRNSRGITIELPNKITLPN